MDGYFDSATDELVYVGPKCNKPNPTFYPRIDSEKGNIFLVLSRNENEGEMIWMEKSTSYIFQDDDSETLHVNIDQWQSSSWKYKGKILEQYWVSNPDGIELGSIPINTVFLAWIPKKEDCRNTKINKCGVQVVLDLLEKT